VVLLRASARAAGRRHSSSSSRGAVHDFNPALVHQWRSSCKWRGRGLTLRSRRRATAWHGGRAALLVIMRRTATAPCRRARLTSNVRQRNAERQCTRTAGASRQPPRCTEQQTPTRRPGSAQHGTNRFTSDMPRSVNTQPQPTKQPTQQGGFAPPCCAGQSVCHPPSQARLSARVPPPREELPSLRHRSTSNKGNLGSQSLSLWVQHAPVPAARQRPLPNLPLNRSANGVPPCPRGCACLSSASRASRHTAVARLALR
jgi:hypothetical protein